MDFGKIFSLLGDESIDKVKIFKLVDKIRTIDLEDEDNLREVIREASQVANKEVTRETEDKLVQKIKEEGISTNLLNLFN